MMLAITPNDINAASARVAGWVHRTPVFTSRTLNRVAGCDVFLKCENFQLGGAFKFRGAANFVLSLSEDQVAHGLLAYSSGNHGQAVALAAAKAGTIATIVMPNDAPEAKVAATEGAGAKIVRYDRFTQDRETLAAGLAGDLGATLIPPFNHPWIIAGQGTAAKELLEDVPSLDALVACVGGGGLLAGCSVAARMLRPSIRIFGAEPVQANDTWLSLQAGERMSTAPSNTIADGLRSPSPGELTFPIIQEYAAGIALITEAEIRASVRFLLERLKLVVEPSGAVGVAATIFHKLPPELKRVGVIVSGGNIDLESLAEICLNADEAEKIDIPS